MERTPAILVFDIGKTNRKALAFDRDYRMLAERFFQVPEAVDEDGHPTEDADRLARAVAEQLTAFLREEAWDIRAVNFTTYGATIVDTDAEGRPLHPVRNYLKPFPPDILDRFRGECDPEGTLCAETASPLLGNLNTGLQLYERKCRDQASFSRIRHSTWLPQYLSAHFTGALFSELTGIGCHTLCWDFRAKDYHRWTLHNGLQEKFPELHSATGPLKRRFEDRELLFGIGMHDSSSALLPYLRMIEHPFILLSTGSWNICLNPFNDEPLTEAELAADCLCYLTFKGTPVKASRLDAGFRHSAFVKRLSEHYGKTEQSWNEMEPDPLYNADSPETDGHFREGIPDTIPGDMDPRRAYHACMAALVREQSAKIDLVLTPPVRHIYVDGGFSRNRVFMHMLRRRYPDVTIAAAEVGQSTALGAALVLHEHWNDLPLIRDLVRFRED